MTIFDSIKYPISDKPTYEELETLPQAIWNDFLHRCGDSDSKLPRTIAFMFLNSIQWDDRVGLLRRTILEYNVQ